MKGALLLGICVSVSQTATNIFEQSIKLGAAFAHSALPSPVAQAWLCHAAGNTDISTTFKVTKEGIELVEPRLPRLAGVRGRSFAAPVLLFELMQRGLYLTPQAKDSGPADLALKVA